MKVTYLEHSGFTAEYKEYVLIFDWYRGSRPEFDHQKKIYVFASHSHYNHFNKKSFGWRKQYPDVAKVTMKEMGMEYSMASFKSLMTNIYLVKRIFKSSGYTPNRT